MIYTGDAKVVLPCLPSESVDSVVTDPSYEFGTGMRGDGAWDVKTVAYDEEIWRETLRILKPGGHLLSFGGARTYHRLATAIENSGFDIRDQLMWIYGSGFPKSYNVSKAIDKMAGAEREVVGTKSTNVGIKGNNFTRGSQAGEVDITVPATDEAKQWEGWGTALKPAHEPIVLARKPLDGTIAESVLEHGTGAINIEESRNGERFPTNVLLSEQGALELDEQTGRKVAQFFYCPKPTKEERERGCEELDTKLKHKVNSGGLENDPQWAPREVKNHHPTVKPLELLRYLVRMVTPPGGTVLDMFLGSGTTAIAAKLEGFDFVGIELEPDYVKIANARLLEWIGEN